MTAGQTGKPTSGDESGLGSGPPERATRPLQFRLSALLVLTAVVAVLFGLLRWVGVPPQAGAVVLVVLVIGALAALGLIAAVFSGSSGGHSWRDEEQGE